MWGGSRACFAGFSGGVRYTPCTTINKRVGGPIARCDRPGQRGRFNRPVVQNQLLHLIGCCRVTSSSRRDRTRARPIRLLRHFASFMSLCDLLSELLFGLSCSSLRTAHHTTLLCQVPSTMIYLLPDALLAQELAAIPGELLVGDARGAAELRGLQGGQRQLHLGRRSMGSRAACRAGQERSPDGNERAGENRGPAVGGKAEKLLR